MATRRKIGVAAGLAVVLAGAWGCWHWLGHPPKPGLVRWQVLRYLKRHASSSDFRIQFPFPSRAEMARAPVKSEVESARPMLGPGTGKDFETLSGEYLALKTEAVILEREISESEAEWGVQKPQLDELTRQLTEAKANGGSTNLASLRSKASGLQRRVAALEKKIASRADWEAKEAALRPIVADLWEFQRVWAMELRAGEPLEEEKLAEARRQLASAMAKHLDETASYEMIYALIGQELWVSGRLLKSADPEHRRTGLSIALQAARHALDNAMNLWLAARIVEGYVWPNLDLARATNRRSPFLLENILNECVLIFRENDELDNVARTYQILLDRASTPQRADWARAQIAMAYEQSGNLGLALKYLRQIELTNDFRWAVFRISDLERRLNARR